MPIAYSLVPGPIGARCVTVDHLRLDLGSVVVWPRRLQHQQLVRPGLTVWFYYPGQATSYKQQASSWLTKKEERIIRDLERWILKQHYRL